MNKKTLLISLVVLFLSSFTVAFQFQFDPLFSDSRFPPSDKLHAWCDHVIDVSLTDYDKLEDLWLILSYSVDDINVTRIVPKQKEWLDVEYNIESWKIKFFSSKQ